MAAQINIKKKTRGGRKEDASGYLQKKQYVNNFWIWIVKRKVVSKNWHFFSTLNIKRMQFEIRKKDPPRVAKFQAIIVLSSSRFYVCIPAADNWWQPK